MTIKKLFKRFLKDENLYGSEAMKKIIEYMETYNNVIVPFNAFRWDTTIQGHDYWFTKEIRWLTFLYKNFGVIDNDEKKAYNYTKSEYDIADRIRYVSTHYHRNTYDFKEKHKEAAEIIEKLMNINKTVKI